MQEAESSYAVIHNEPKSRFEIQLAPGALALLAYRRRGTTLDLAHTEVPAEWQRRGIAAQLVHAAFEYARENNLTVVPSCPYVQDYLRRNPEYRALVAAWSRE